MASNGQATAPYAACSTGTIHSQYTTQLTFSKFSHARKPVGPLVTTRRFSGAMTVDSTGKEGIRILTTARIHIRFLRPPGLVSGRFRSIATTTSPGARFNGTAG